MIVEAIDGLFAVDAFTGRRLWSYRIENVLNAYDQEHLVGTAGTGSNMCLGDDSVFVRQGGRCLRIDMKTGTLLREYTVPDEDGAWGYIAWSDGAAAFPERVEYGGFADPVAESVCFGCRDG